MKKKIIFILLLTTSLHAQTQQQVVTFISPRSQSFNNARFMSGWDDQIHCPKEGFYSTYSLAGEVNSTFRTERINQCLFGEDIIRRDKNDTEWKDCILISGSQTENRIPNKDWLADYFGLPTDFKSTVRFRPRVNNYIIDGQAFFGLNNIKKGLYLLFDIPFVYTNSDINIQELVTQPGTNGYDPGYYNATGVDRENLLTCFTQFISGSAIPTINGLQFQPLNNAKMDPKSRRKIGFAELRAAIGYDHFINEIHHVGCSLIAAAPCGNRPKAEFLFEPMCGNGHHWELGVGLSAHACTWEKIDTNERTDLFFEGSITHLFSAKQRRSFDLQGKPNSRYMIAQKTSPEISNNLTGNGTTPIAQFSNEVAPVANITTFDVSVAINAQADMAFMYVYTRKENSYTFGYSAWKRGCEKVTIRNCGSFTENSWALKGDAYLFGFIAQQPTPNDLPVGFPVPLSATESGASINTGTNFPRQGLSADQAQQALQLQTARRNSNIDFPQPAFAGNNQYLVATGGDLTQANQIQTSIQPQLITWSSIDINSAETSGFSHKIFTHFRHKIRDHRRYDAYIGIGAEVEFGRQAGPMPAIGADKCINCALSCWGVWLKGNVSF